MPSGVLDENIVRAIGICMLTVALFGLDPSQKLQGMGSLFRLMRSVRNPCYGAPPERFPSGGALGPLGELRRSSTGALETDSLQYSLPGILMTHIVLDEDIVKTLMYLYDFCHNV